MNIPELLVSKTYYACDNNNYYMFIINDLCIIQYSKKKWETEWKHFFTVPYQFKGFEKKKEDIIRFAKENPMPKK